jgi:hypothetical protein
MVSQGNEVRSDSIRSAREKRMPHVPRPLLEIGARNQTTKSLGPLDDQLNPKPRAHSAQELFITIRLIAANPMVQMSGRDPDSEPLANLEQRGGKRDRIGTAGKPNEYGSAAHDSTAQKRCLNRGNDSLFSIPKHH